MGNLRAIWNHEADQASRIARRLLHANKITLGWRILLLPNLLIHYVRYSRNLNRTRRNLLFTKRMAFDAAKEIKEGESHGTEIRLIEIKTKKLLDQERKGYYTEKVRRKQMQEIELLIDHYLSLSDSQGKNYTEMLRATYGSKEKYLSFLRKLQKAEQEVIQAAVTTMRKASKQERAKWFRGLKEAVKEVRMEEAEMLFPDTR